MMFSSNESPLRSITVLMALVLACGLGLFSLPTIAQEAPAPSKEPLVIPKIQGLIELDGRVEEEAWKEARSLPLIQQRPSFGEEPTEKTEVLIGYTEEALYVACRCYDRFKPSASSFKRDYNAQDTDYIGLLLDTFNDNENALVFATAPTGLRADFAVSGDGGSVDVDWDSFWDAEATQSEKGWFVEMRIPISSLRFQAERGKATMGLTFWRFLAREREASLFPAIPLKWGYLSHLKVSQARDVVFKDLEPQTPLRVTPYLLGGLGQQSVLNRAETAFQKKTNPTYDLGLDVKYGLTSNLTFDLTVNTDFAQVEADDQQVNLTRFPLFFPEKRRFFLERASNFEFNFGRVNRLFYSRRVGLYQGQQVRILGGARLVGRHGPWDIGVLNMQTAREPNFGPGGETLPSENFSVARLRRQVVNENSYVGGILTSRLGMDGSYNLAYGADGLFRVEGDKYVSFKWAQTFEDESSSRFASLDPSRLQLKWEERSYEGFNYELRYDRAGPNYNPGVGLELRENYFRLGDEVGYGWVPGEESSIQRHRISLTGETYFRNADRSIQSLEVGPEWAMATNMGHNFTLEATRHVEDVRRAFSLSGEAGVPRGRYGFYLGEVSYGMPGDWDVRANLSLTGGSFYDGHRGTFQVSPTWNASRYLRLSGFYQLNRISFPDRGQGVTSSASTPNIFTTHVSRLRVEVTPSVEYSISGFVQHNSARGLAIGNLRFRYNPRQGNDLYLVYNERLNTDRSPDRTNIRRGTDPPKLPLSSQRAVMLKYTYTFNW